MQRACAPQTLVGRRLSGVVTWLSRGFICKHCYLFTKRGLMRPKTTFQKTEIQTSEPIPASMVICPLQDHTADTPSIFFHKAQNLPRRVNRTANPTSPLFYSLSVYLTTMLSKPCRLRTAQQPTCRSTPTSWRRFLCFHLPSA